MSDDIRNLLIDSLTRVLNDHCGPEQVQAAEEQGWDAALWKRIEELGFSLAGIPEDSGGAGGSVGDAAAMLRVAGRYCAPIPLLETGLLASWALSASGCAIAEGPLTVAPVEPGGSITLSREGAAWKLSGRARRVPMARHAQRIVVFAETGGGTMLSLVEAGACSVRPGANLAGEARDDVEFPDLGLSPDAVAPAGPGVDLDALLRRGALGRAVQMAGALERALELSLEYAQERKQFGRPIGKFQALQQQLAIFAGEVSAAGAIVEFAADRVDTRKELDCVAAAKIRVGQAAGVGAKIAHQVHGAIGVTEEYPLQQATRRLWAWRDEFGTESHWALRLGQAVARNGADALWQAITDSPPE